MGLCQQDGGDAVKCVIPQNLDRTVGNSHYIIIGAPLAVREAASAPHQTLACVNWLAHATVTNVVRTGTAGLRASSPPATSPNAWDSCLGCSAVAAASPHCRNKRVHLHPPHAHPRTSQTAAQSAPAHTLALLCRPPTLCCGGSVLFKNIGKNQWYCQ